MRYADPLAQAEIDRLEEKVTIIEDGVLASAEMYRNEIDRLRACSDPTPPAEGERHTAEQMWHVLLEASSHRRLYVLNQFLEAQDDALRCFLEHGAHSEESPTCDSCGRWTDRHPWLWCKTPTAHTGPR